MRIAEVILTALLFFGMLATPVAFSGAVGELADERTRWRRHLVPECDGRRRQHDAEPVRAHGNGLTYTVTAEQPDRASFTQQADGLHRPYR